MESVRDWLMFIIYIIGGILAIIVLLVVSLISLIVNLFMNINGVVSNYSNKLKAEAELMNIEIEKSKKENE